VTGLLKDARRRVTPVRPRRAPALASLSDTFLMFAMIPLLTPSAVLRRRCIAALATPRAPARSLIDPSAMVNTFLPFASFEASVRCLDNKRLGKQRVEAYQARRDGGCDALSAAACI
jgi:hypothetical protein